VKVAILGAGGLGKVMLEAIQAEGKHSVAGFLDDQVRDQFCALPILGPLASLAGLRRRKISGVALAIGDRFLKVRLDLIATIWSSGLRAINVVHPTAWISPSSRLGQGLYIGPHVVIHAGASIADYCVIWSGSVIEHDVRLDENVFVASSVSLAGYTEVGRDTFVGIGAVLMRSRIGESATIAAGSLVTKDVTAKTVVMGCPARAVGRKRAVAYHS